MSDQCNDHPLAPHGFDRNASHTEGRYVCNCEGWSIQDAIDDLHPALVAQIEADVLRRVAEQAENRIDDGWYSVSPTWLRKEADRLLKEAQEW